MEMRPRPASEPVRQFAGPLATLGIKDPAATEIAEDAIEGGVEVGAPTVTAAATINVSVSVGTFKVSSTSVEHPHHAPHDRGTCFDGISRGRADRPVIRDTPDRDGVTPGDRDGVLGLAGRTRAADSRGTAVEYHAARDASRLMGDSTIAHDRNDTGNGANAAVRGTSAGSTSTWAAPAVRHAGSTP